MRLFLVLLFLSPLLTVHAEDQFVAPDSKNRLVKLSDEGISPSVLKMKQDDSLVFFLNSTTDSLTTLELDYHGRRTHCATGNLKIDPDGVARSRRPFGPQNFALVCFPEKGTYDLKVFGLKKNPAGISSKIIVE